MGGQEFQYQVIVVRPQLYSFALRLTRDRDSALDLLQESLTKAFIHRDGFQQSTNFKAWLYTIMKNTFINHHRRTKRARKALENIQHTRSVQSLSNNQSEGRILMADLMRTLDSLDHTLRQPFKMHHDGYKYHEIAGSLDIPVGTVKSRIHQARQRLMKMLTEQRS